MTDLRARLACENTAALNGVPQIGSSGYDTGHVLHSGSLGGYGHFGVVCGGSKGASSSITAASNPGVRLMAHELGHNFDGRHTFSGSDCPSAHDRLVEVGSGSSVMSYSGACGNQNTPANNFFHIDSLIRMSNYIDRGGSCFAPAATGNETPEVSAGPDKSIPKLTSFELIGTGSDESEDVDYSWEQRDFSAYVLNPLTDTGQGPWFRVLPPEPQPSQAFTDQGTIGEKLPVLARTGANAFTFYLVARDNVAGAGGTSWDSMRLTVQGDRFRVTGPAPGAWVTDNPATVTWDVGGGSTASEVDVYVSTNGGADYTFITRVPNTGSAQVTLPICPTTTYARIKLKGVNQLFFDETDGNFVMACPCPDTWTCNGPCMPDPCQTVYPGWENCWDGAELEFCERGTSISITNCECQGGVGGSGGNQHITQGCGPDTQGWSCPLIPDCPAETRCSPCNPTQVLGICGYIDQGFSECRQPTNTKFTCSGGETVHVRQCPCDDPQQQGCPGNDNELVCCPPGGCL